MRTAFLPFSSSRLIVPAVLVACCGLAGCSSDDGATPVADTGTPSDTGATDSGTSDTGTSDTGETGPTGSIFVRVAHLSPNAPAVDFCVKGPGATAFTGPVVGSLGVASGLPFPKVTRYLELPKGAYTVRLVAPGSTSCDAALGGLADVSLPDLPAGTHATAAAIGVLGGTGPSAFKIQPLVDDTTTPASGKFRLRFVHAAPAVPAVDVGTTSGTGATEILATPPLVSNVAFGAASASYLEAALLSNVTLGAAATGTTALALRVPGVSTAAGKIYSAFAIGQAQHASPLQLLVCEDTTTKASAGDPLTSCSVLPASAFVRVAHLSPNAPAVNVCARLKSGAAFGDASVKPVLASTGLAYKQVTKYLALPPGDWQFRLVAANATSCATPLASLPDYDVTLTDGAWATAAAVGSVGATGATAFTVKPLVDVHPVPAAGKLHARFVHASPANNVPVDVGVLASATATSLSPTIFGGVGFGNVASGASFVSGFTALDAPVNARLGASAGSAIVWKSKDPVALAAGGVYSLFALDGIDVLACDDRAPADANGLAACSVVPK
jgi:hypothetical protein